MIRRRGNLVRGGEKALIWATCSTKCKNGKRIWQGLSVGQSKFEFGPALQKRGDGKTKKKLCVDYAEGGGPWKLEEPIAKKLNGLTALKPRQEYPRPSRKGKEQITANKKSSEKTPSTWRAQYFGVLKKGHWEKKGGVLGPNGTKEVGPEPDATKENTKKNALIS